MSARIEVPFPPRPAEARGGHISPPWVPVTPRWEYKEVVRSLETEALPTEQELDQLGADGWSWPASPTRAAGCTSTSSGNEPASEIGNVEIRSPGQHHSGLSRG